MREGIEVSSVRGAGGTVSASVTCTGLSTLGNGTPEVCPMP
jgi:hypothetical protein